MTTVRRTANNRGRPATDGASSAASGHEPGAFGVLAAGAPTALLVSASDQFHGANLWSLAFDAQP